MRYEIFSLLLSSALFSCCNLINAQQSSPPPAAVPQHIEELSAANQDAKGHATQPPAEMQSLIKALSGKWAVTVKFDPNAAMPNGGGGDGEEIWRPGPGGYTFLDEEHLPTPAGDVYLIGIIWWDGRTKEFHGMECNNQLPYTCDVKGALNDITMKWDGKQFTIDELETSQDGKKTMWHEVWSDITPVSFTQTGDTCEIGGSCKRFVTIHATKAVENAEDKGTHSPRGDRGSDWRENA